MKTSETIYIKDTSNLWLSTNHSCFQYNHPYPQIITQNTCFARADTQQLRSWPTTSLARATCWASTLKRRRCTKLFKNGRFYVLDPIEIYRLEGCYGFFKIYQHFMSGFWDVQIEISTLAFVVGSWLMSCSMFFLEFSVGSGAYTSRGILRRCFSCRSGKVDLGNHKVLSIWEENTAMMIRDFWVGPRYAVIRNAEHYCI